MGERPGIGAPQHSKHPALAHLRVWPIKGFPDMDYYYLDISQAVDVVRVLHSKRDVIALLRRGITSR